MDSGDPIALVASVDHRIVSGEAASVNAVQLADAGRRTLYRSPLNPGGLRLLALSADLDRDRAAAEALMKMSIRASRRDLFTHTWMIEDRVAAGDIAGALNHYDLALSTSSQAPQLLFPVLASALDDAEIRAAFLPFLRARRPWMPAFLTYAIATSREPQYLATLFMAPRALPPTAAYQPLPGQLLRQLVAKRRYDAAYGYARVLRPGAVVSLNTVAFNDNGMDPALAPLTWQLSEEVQTRAYRDGDDGIVVSAASNSRGSAAIRLLFLRGGHYRFDFVVAPTAAQSAAAIGWELRCLSPDRNVLWSQEVVAPAKPQAYRANLTVPAGCKVQQFILFGVGGDGQVEAATRVGPIKLIIAAAMQIPAGRVPPERKVAADDRLRGL